MQFFIILWKLTPLVLLLLLYRNKIVWKQGQTKQCRYQKISWHNFSGKTTISEKWAMKPYKYKQRILSVITARSGADNQFTQ